MSQCGSTIFFFVLINVAILATSSDPAGFLPRRSSGRSLLQSLKACSVNFEFLNYSVIQNQCKGPNYPPADCCSAFKEIACRYVDEINDASSDCASTIFSYISLHGKYPPGLFASECREGKEGLACNVTSISSKVAYSSTCTHSYSLFLLFLCGALIL